MRKPDFGICENKDADQLRSNWLSRDMLYHYAYMSVHYTANFNGFQNDALIQIFGFFLIFCSISWYEPRRQKTGLRGFRPGPTQIRLRRLRKWLEAWNFVFRKERDCTSRVAKTKALISFAVSAKLICVFVFAYAKIRFSHVAAHNMSV